MPNPKSIEPPRPGGAGLIKLDHLIALNDEIIALVRAGVPLESGLSAASRDLRGRLGSITSRLARHLEQGQSLPEALDAERDQLPPVYRAVVMAGMSSGRLTAAMEGLSDFARTYGDLRRTIGMALIYPLTIVMLAYGLFVGFVTFILPRILGAFESLGLGIPKVVHGLTWLGENAVYWVPIGPVLAVVLLLWWNWTGRSSLIGPGAGSAGLSLFPWMRSILKNARAAHFSDLLALMIDHEVPLPKALILAANASGDHALIQDAERMSASLERGAPLYETLREATSLPALLRWLMSAGYQQGSLANALSLGAETYRRRAMGQADVLRIFLPTALLILLGATTTLVYMLTLFVPMASLLGELSE